MKNELLQIRGLTVSFPVKGRPALAVDDIDLAISEKSTVCLVGESGSGKTLTALSIMGLVPAPGSVTALGIFLNGNNILKYTDDELRAMRGGRISMIFQEPFTSLNPVFRVSDQIGEAVELHLKIKGKEKDEKVLAALRLVGVNDAERVANSYPHELSGGLRQRVMIAMGLISEPALLIADEPTTALDVTVQAQILELLKTLKEKLSLSVLLITHDLGIVNETGDYVYVMYAGKIMESGKKTAIFCGPKHPYTEGLLKSMPGFGPAEERLYTIEGSIPDPSALPKGCRFHPRCPYVMDVCREKAPGKTDLEENHSVWCFKYWIKAYNNKKVIFNKGDAC